MASRAAILSETSAFPPSHAVALPPVTGPTSTVVYDRSIMQAIESLSNKIDALNSRFAQLEKTIDALMNVLSEDDSERGVLLRDNIDDRTISEEIRNYFSDNDGEVIYPSDVATALAIDYERAVKLIEFLVRDGKIRKI